MKKEKKDKIKKELQELKELKALDDIMKKSDAENVFLSAPSLESEATSESFADSMLEKSNISKADMNSLDALEKSSIHSRSRKPERKAQKTRKMSKKSARKTKKTAKKTKRR